jgi:hypothetical protein
MKNEMPSLLLDEKLSFTRLPPETLPNFWEVITYWGGKLKGITGRIQANSFRKSPLYMLKSYFSAREKEKIRPKQNLVSFFGSILCGTWCHN